MRLVAALLLIVALALPAAATSPSPGPTPLLGEVLALPRLVPGSDGRRHLVYELRLSNVTDQPVVLTRLAVLDAASGQALAELRGAAIAARFAPGGGRGEGTTTLGAFQFGVAFLHLALAEDAVPPAALLHEVEAEVARMGGATAMRIGATRVVATPPVVLGPPMRGGGYLAADGCCGSTRHIRALLPIGGTLRLAQRFAIDWERIDDSHRLVRGDLRDPRSYVIYGEPVLAVAEGVVAAARDGLPDQVPGALPSGIGMEEVDGNFVVLDLGNDVFVLYAHLRPGSLRVRVGERVRRGQVLGAVGNTGNSQAPHLHLHVMDGRSPLAADGLPYVFDDFTVTAVDEAGTADFDRAEATGSPLTLTPRSPPERQRERLPLDLSVVTWPDAAPP